MSQLALFTGPAARRSDPTTSKLAALQVRMRAGSHRALILRALEQAGRRGATHREIAALSGLDPVQVDRRLVELRRLGLVVRIAEVRGEPAAHVQVLTIHEVEAPPPSSAKSASQPGGPETGGARPTAQPNQFVGDR